MIGRTSIKTSLNLLVLAVVSAPLLGNAAEFRVLPSITVSQEYTDNAYLVPASANPLSDWITRLAPGVQMTYASPRLDGNASLTYDYRHHTEDTVRKDRNETLPLVHLTTLARIVPDFLFLDVRDDYTRVSLTPTRDYTQESSFVNQTDTNVFSMNPYATIRMSDRSMLTAGYRYRSTWYKNPQSIDTVEHEGYGDVRQNISQRMVVSGGVHYVQNNNDTRMFSKTDISVGQTYEYGEGSSLATTIGYARFHIETEATSRPREIFWDISEQHGYSTLTLQLATSRKYLPDPLQILRREDQISATARKSTERTVLVVRGGIYKYFNANTKDLESTNHRASGSATYRTTPFTNIMGSITVERSDDAVLRTRSRRHQYGLRLDQAASETLTWSVNYSYGIAEDHEVSANNYRNNRFIVELKKAF